MKSYNIYKSKLQYFCCMGIFMLIFPLSIFERCFSDMLDNSANFSWVKPRCSL